MNLSQAALRRPVTVLVIMAGIVLAAGLSLRQMAIDIFPNMGVPIVYVAQPYGGMDPAQMEGYLTKLLRVPLSLRLRHRARRVEEHSGRRPDEALFPPGHGHVPGDGGGDRPRQPLAGVHAAGHGAAVRHAL